MPGTRTEPFAATRHGPGVDLARRRRDDGRGAVGEEGVGDRSVGLGAVREVQATQLGRAEEDATARLARGEGAGDPQAVQGAVAAHEADVGPLDGRVELQASIRRRSNPGAANPVHETVTRCVIEAGDTPDRASATPAARRASGHDDLLVAPHPPAGRRAPLRRRDGVGDGLPLVEDRDVPARDPGQAVKERQAFGL